MMAQKYLTNITMTDREFTPRQINSLTVERNLEKCGNFLINNCPLHLAALTAMAKGSLLNRWEGNISQDVMFVVFFSSNGAPKSDVVEEAKRELERYEKKCADCQLARSK